MCMYTVWKNIYEYNIYADWPVAIATLEYSVPTRNHLLTYHSKQMLKRWRKGHIKIWKKCTIRWKNQAREMGSRMYLLNCHLPPVLFRKIKMFVSVIYRTNRRPRVHDFNAKWKKLCHIILTNRQRKNALIFDRKGRNAISSYGSLQKICCYSYTNRGWEVVKN